MMSVLDVLAARYATTPDRILTVRNAKPETLCRQMFFWYSHVWLGQSTRDIAARVSWSESTVRYSVYVTKVRARSMPGFAAECEHLVRSQQRTA